ncbi:MAG: NAD(+) diphosphatase [Micrococcales bacterium]|nr:NAD(+) diphosphatase [Micrococcales bacterium]MCL2667386.1 NAD(+) diphosphatase [Micrococcales bacterium]
MEELPLARSSIDRDAVRRTDAPWLAAARTDPATRVVLVRDGSVLTTGGGPAADPWAEPDPGVALAVLDPATAVATVGEPRDDAWLFLGTEPDAQVWFALRVVPTGSAPLVGASSDVLVHPAGAVAPGSPDAAVPGGDAVPRGDAVPGGPVWTPLRAVGAVLSDRDAGLATAAVALDHWHTTSRCCPRCGGPTHATTGGWVRVCQADGSEHYPRTDPAVIMAVVDGDERILLGHNVAWPARRFSTLAGFVEAGESLEAAVRREVAEETGVQVTGVDYVASQPWPFPSSLMLGFRAHAQAAAPQPDGTELTDARWFTRSELVACVQGGQVVLPGRTSLARVLIEDWFGSRLL